MRRNLRGMGGMLFLAFAAAALPSLVAAGLLLEWQTRRALERELAHRVEYLAVAIGAAIPAATWQLLFSLGPGEEESRTASHLRARLARIADETGCASLAVWTGAGTLVLDSRGALGIGSPAPRMALVERELGLARSGRTSSTPLFRTQAGRLMKIGLAPIRLDDTPGTPAGVLLVEAPSGSLDVVAAMRRTLLLIGLAGGVLVLGTALILARRLTQRITRLTAAARRIAQGDLDSHVPALGADELGYLAGALDSMRGAVQLRERQLRAMVGGVAHEIRNPLGGLILYAEMLARDRRLDSAQARKAQQILTEGLRLERIVAAFLDYARPAQPRQSAVALGPLCEECAASAAAGLQWPGSCQVEVGEQVVAGDGDHLRQILHNLLRNAMEAAGPAGRVRLAVTGVAEGCELRVDDSGSGVAPAEQERVFEPFRSGKPDGAGLGLAIAKRLCDLGDIGIGVSTGELGGARFWLRFRYWPGHWQEDGERGAHPDS